MYSYSVTIAPRDQFDPSFLVKFIKKKADCLMVTEPFKRGGDHYHALIHCKGKSTGNVTRSFKDLLKKNEVYVHPMRTVVVKQCKNQSMRDGWIGYCLKHVDDYLDITLNIGYDDVEYLDKCKKKYEDNEHVKVKRSSKYTQHLKFVGKSQVCNAIMDYMEEEGIRFKDDPEEFNRIWNAMEETHLMWDLRRNMKAIYYQLLNMHRLQEAAHQYTVEAFKSQLEEFRSDEGAKNGGYST